MKLGAICFSMPSAISRWRPIYLRGIGCDMAMSDVEEKRGLKITPGSVEVPKGEIEGLLTKRECPISSSSSLSSFLQLRVPLEVKASNIVRKMCSAET